MSIRTEHGLTLTDAITILTKHRRMMSVIVGGVLLVAFVAVLVWPRSYRSEGKLLVRPTANYISQDPTMMKQQHNMTMPELGEQEINSIVEILSSRAISERVVKDLGVATILGDTKDETATGQPQTPAQHKRHNKAIERVSDHLKISTPSKTTIIDISYDASTPALAKKVTDVVMKVYMQEHIRANQTDGSYLFFKEQVEQLERELDLAAQALKDTKNGMGLASIEGRRLALENHYKEIESQTIQTNRGLASAESRVASLEKTLSKLPTDRVSEKTTGIASHATDIMRNEMFKLEAQEKAVDFTIHGLSSQRHFHQSPTEFNYEKIFSSMEKNRTHSTTRTNPVFEKLEMEWLTEKTNVETLTAQKETLHSQKNLVLNDLKQLNIDEIKIRELERDLALAESNLQVYAEQKETARVHDALESHQISNVRIVQSGTYVDDPIAPRKGLALAGALVFAVTLAVGLAFLIEAISPRAFFAMAPTPDTDAVPENNLQTHTESVRKESEPPNDASSSRGTPPLDISYPGLAAASNEATMEN